jgi:dipeptidyl-peptidase-4
MTSSSALSPYISASYRINGEKIKVMEDNALLNETLAKSNFSKKEFFELKLSDSVTVSGWMIKPPKMKKHKKYPLLFSIYGGPGIQTVNDAWGGSLDIWYQYLAQQGYIIVSIDNRGTGGKGNAFKQTTYKKLGQKESDDQISAARYFANQSFVDPTRIGIYGWSFGGYMSALCITKGADIFNTAISVAPVTDWRLYDNIYTERYMGMPKDNASNYDATSVLTYVPKMKGNLLVVYGTYDDNVHPQNSIMLIKKMVELNKKFDSECYPNKNHGIYGGYTRLHLYTRITDYILEHL